MRLIILLIILSYTTIVDAEIYKWVDQDGRTHYGDKPQDKNATIIGVDSAPELDASHEKRSETQRRLLHILEEEREENRELKEQVAAEKLARQQKCDAARKDLEKINSASFLYKKTDDPLNPAVYSQEERDQITRGAENAVEQWCRPSRRRPTN